MVVTLVASYIHHRFVLDTEEFRLYHYIIPLLVGITFGAVISLVINLHNALREKERELRELASTDSLTGLLNRRTLMELLRIEVSRARRKGTPLSIAVVDLDDFKHINDTYGHVVGDKALIELTKVMRRNLRATDLIGRFGGEEFIIVMPETDLKTALKVMERIRRAVEETFFEPVGSISVSVGVAELKGDEEIESFIRRADEALYRAKREGKNRVVFA